MFLGPYTLLVTYLCMHHFSNISLHVRNLDVKSLMKLTFYKNGKLNVRSLMNALHFMLEAKVINLCGNCSHAINLCPNS